MASSGPTDTATALEAFFVPCARLRRKFLRLLDDGFLEHNEYEYEYDEDEEDFVDPREIEHVRLRSGFSLNDILASDAGFTWKSLFECFAKKVVWVTDDSFLYPESHSFDVANPEQQCFWTWTIQIAENTAFSEQTLFCTPEDEHEASEFLLNLATRSDPRSLELSCGDVIIGWGLPRALPLQRRSLVQFWAGKLLEDFKLTNALLSVAHWQALETVSRADLELELGVCKLLRNDESHRAAMVQCLQASKGPTSLICFYDVRTLSRAVTGNTRITLISDPGGSYLDEDTLPAFGRALFQMQGLTELRMLSAGIEDCITFFPMLKGHATLAVLSTASYMIRRPGEPSAALKAELTSVLSDLARTTPSLKEIRASCSDEFVKQVFKCQVVPYLETNIHIPRVKAIAKIKCGDFRRKVLGRALSAVRSNPNLLWMYLSENADAVFFAGHVGGGKRKRE